MMNEAEKISEDATRRKRSSGKWVCVECAVHPGEEPGGAELEDYKVFQCEIPYTTINNKYNLWSVQVSSIWFYLLSAKQRSKQQAPIINLIIHGT